MKIDVIDISAGRDGWKATATQKIPVDHRAFNRTELCADRMVTKEDSEDSEEENNKLGSFVNECNRLAESVAKLSESKGVVVYRSHLRRWRIKTGGVATIRPSARRAVDRLKEAGHVLGVYLIVGVIFLFFSKVFKQPD